MDNDWNPYKVGKIKGKGVMEEGKYPD
jgi:hypothetical protein